MFIIQAHSESPITEDQRTYMKIQENMEDIDIRVIRNDRSKRYTLLGRINTSAMAHEAWKKSQWAKDTSEMIWGCFDSHA